MVDANSMAIHVYLWAMSLDSSIAAALDRYSYVASIHTLQYAVTKPIGFNLAQIPIPSPDRLRPAGLPFLAVH